MRVFTALLAFSMLCTVSSNSNEHDADHRADIGEDTGGCSKSGDYCMSVGTTDCPMQQCQTTTCGCNPGEKREVYLNAWASVSKACALKWAARARHAEKSSAEDTFKVRKDKYATTSCVQKEGNKEKKQARLGEAKKSRDVKQGPVTLGVAMRAHKRDVARGLRKGTMEAVGAPPQFAQARAGGRFSTPFSRARSLKANELGEVAAKTPSPPPGWGKVQEKTMGSCKFSYAEYQDAEDSMNKAIEVLTIGCPDVKDCGVGDESKKKKRDCFLKQFEFQLVEDKSMSEQTYQARKADIETYDNWGTPTPVPSMPPTSPESPPEDPGSGTYAGSGTYGGSGSYSGSGSYDGITSQVGGILSNWFSN